MYKSKDDRNKEIYLRRKSGETITSLAKVYGVSKERISEIVEAAEEIYGEKSMYKDNELYLRLIKVTGDPQIARVTIKKHWTFKDIIRRNRNFPVLDDIKGISVNDIQKVTGFKKGSLRFHFYEEILKELEGE